MKRRVGDASRTIRLQKKDVMNSGPAHWALAHLNTWTWFVAEYRTWLIVLATVAGLAAPFLGATRKCRPGPAPSVVIRSAALALAFSAATVTACSLLHFSDLRWLPPGQRATAHLDTPGGPFGFAKGSWTGERCPMPDQAGRCRRRRGGRGPGRRLGAVVHVLPGRVRPQLPGPARLRPRLPAAGGRRARPPGLSAGLQAPDLLPQRAGRLG